MRDWSLLKDMIVNTMNDAEMTQEERDVLMWVQDEMNHIEGAENV